jgi:hypothetical protein
VNEQIQQLLPNRSMILGTLYKITIKCHATFKNLSNEQTIWITNKQHKQQIKTSDTFSSINTISIELISGGFKNEGIFQSLRTRTLIRVDRVRNNLSNIIKLLTNLGHGG